jgi:hypothetical protein
MLQFTVRHLWFCSRLYVILSSPFFQTKKSMDLTPGSEQEDFLHQTIGGDEEDAFGFVDPAESGFGYAAPPANQPPKHAVPVPLLRHVEEAEEEDQVYKAKYRAAKKKFFKAVEKHEYLRSELRTRQKKLQQVEEDKYFLLERMLLYEKAPESPACGLSDGGSDWEESDAAAATPGGKKGGGTKATSIFNSGGVTFSSAFSKMKSLSAAGKRTRRPAAKAKLFDEVFDSPTVSSFGTAFDDEAQSSSFLAGGIGGVMEDDSE